MVSGQQHVVNLLVYYLRTDALFSVTHCPVGRGCVPRACAHVSVWGPHIVSNIVSSHLPPVLICVYNWKPCDCSMGGPSERRAHPIDKVCIGGSEGRTHARATDVLWSYHKIDTILTMILLF